MAGLAWIVLYAGAIAAGQRSPALGKFVAFGLYLVPIVIAVVLSWFAAARTEGRVRLAWRLMFVSNALWFAAELTWGLYAYLAPKDAPVPSFADLGYLLSYATAVPAVLVGLGFGVLGGARGLFDFLLVFAAVFAVGWELVVGPLLPSSLSAGLQALVAFFFPVISMSIFSSLIAAVVAGRRRVPVSMILVGVAFGLSAASEAGYLYLSKFLHVIQPYAGSGWLNLGWQAEAVLLCIAALVAVRRSEGDQRLTPDRDMTILPALVAFLTVVGLAVFDLVLVDELRAVTLAVSVLLMVGLLLRQILAVRDRARLTRQLQTAADTDSLTGLYNRRFCAEMLHAEAGLSARRQTPLSLILIDLDHFKNVNDTYGHAAGDVVLVEAAHRLRRTLRASDLVSRYGGEEFLCVLPGTGEEAAVALAEHIRSALSRTPVTIPDVTDGVVLTASLGVSTGRTSRQGTPIDVDKLVNAADQAVYRAKAQGRDRVVGPGQPSRPDLDPLSEIPAELIWLADQIDARVGDHEHSAAVSRWSLRTAARVGLDQAVQHRTAAAARLHDVGKIGVDWTLLAKPTPLNAQEWEQIRRHPEEGARLVTHLADRQDLAPLIAAHHERYDGTGYPRGLAGANIPVEARVIAVCDAWATMRASRPYSPVLADIHARDELARGRGTQFDPVVVDAFLALLDEGVIDEPAPLRSRTWGPRSGRARVGFLPADRQDRHPAR
ncbi:bifunctional diguanylate cyclase/phosphohydrolase [Longispora fulva]|uniref:Diguanylate cyclase (GGDEF)-like protein n=1 Tax=Longispora fulva TaxID=619741 RepID=A0A8J7G765_9ACTN|nr:diguanylate cyclase [Longispora fulva]MBG6134125.1 diguanylate cyclase (GGDEF)-like protein [Longispora fulva]